MKANIIKLAKITPKDTTKSIIKKLSNYDAEFYSSHEVEVTAYLQRRAYLSFEQFKNMLNDSYAYYRIEQTYVRRFTTDPLFTRVMHAEFRRCIPELRKAGLDPYEALWHYLNEMTRRNSEHLPYNNTKSTSRYAVPKLKLRKGEQFVESIASLPCFDISTIIELPEVEEDVVHVRELGPAYSIWLQAVTCSSDPHATLRDCFSDAFFNGVLVGNCPDHRLRGRKNNTKKRKS